MDEDFKRVWAYSKDNLMTAMRSLGFPDELGEAVVKNLGSPKAMDRMTSYLRNVRPTTPELVVDEMLAIRSVVETWKARKESLEANAAYNEVLNNGLGDDEPDW
jgi:hypothetical protein